jgi:hypothetical protein
MQTSRRVGIGSPAAVAFTTITMILQTRHKSSVASVARATEPADRRGSDDK